MQEASILPNISDYVSMKQAAKMLGVSEKSVYRYIEAGRLPAVQAGHNIMLPLEAVKHFKPNLVGRPRKKTPAWHASPGGSSFLITYIRVQLRPGKQAKLVEKLRTIKQQERHLFPGTVTRYISYNEASPVTVTIQLVWKNGEMADEATRQQAFADFEAELADVLDWRTAHYTTERSIIHT